ncbi:major facilitator superfamily transporter [Rhexocercosporidium sp. MPI-PUGE-AT-0058]|nr:major facilitator superfamily transporter [Rhexocercosporidium sp. MPI-PUGE-AT-0058]
MGASNSEKPGGIEAAKVETNQETSVEMQWGQLVEIDDGYLRASMGTKIWRSVLFQMVLFGALSFVGPAMSDAISNLGGGGLSTPFLANLATSLNYAAGFVVTLFGGPLINKLGIKWSCIIASITMPLAGSGYYVNARFGVDWYLLFSRIVGGLFNGFLYVGETTAMLSYPDQNDRGLFLGIWSAMRNTGSIVGGAINFSTNYTASSAGGIAWSTYLIFVGFECTGIIWACMLSPTSKVRRRDGSKVAMSVDISWGQEIRALWKHAQRRKTWLMFFPAFYSFFYGGTLGTYLSLHFSVRARALSSLITPAVTIPMVIAYGRLLDQKRWSQISRAWLGFLVWVIPQVGCFIWMGIEYSKFGANKTALDYELQTNRWAEAYLPYMFIFSTGYLCQLSLYWILGTFSTDVKSSARTGGLFRAFETLGQTVSYAVNSNAAADPRHAYYINCTMLAIVIPCMVALICMVPEAPASHDIDVEGPLPETEG